MIENLPIFVPLIFALTTIATLLLFYITLKRSSLPTAKRTANIALLILSIWLALQAFITLRNIYNTNTATFPPKIGLMGVLPMIITIIVLFITPKGKRFIDSLPLVNITYTNIIRIPVEFVLLWLFIYKAAPQLMTFEGRNFDIIAGLTAPFIAYYGLQKGKFSRMTILIWNYISLALLLNIVIIAVLSAPLFLQRFAFDQPNIAILNFPFSWLPTFIVPIILFGHLVSIRQLNNAKEK